MCEACFLKTIDADNVISTPDSVEPAAIHDPMLFNFAGTRCVRWSDIQELMVLPSVGKDGATFYRVLAKERGRERPSMLVYRCDDLATAKAYIRGIVLSMGSHHGAPLSVTVEPRYGSVPGVVSYAGYVALPDQEASYNPSHPVS
jgi:hypothetical protein